MNSETRPCHLFLIATLCLAVLLSGCALERKTGDMVLDAEATPESSLSREELLLRLFAFYDEYIARIEEATDTIEYNSTDPQRRLMAHGTKYYPSISLLWIISGMDQEEALLNVVCVVTLERMVWGDGWAEEEFGEDAPRLKAAQLYMEKEAWELVARVMEPRQVENLRQVILDWRAANPDQKYVSTIRFSDLIADKPNHDLRRLLSVRTAFDDTARNVEEARLLGERTLFVTERLPLIAQWQAELLLYDLALSPEFKKASEDVDKLTSSTATIAAIVKELPELVAEQRRSTIREFKAAIAEEREAFFSQLSQTNEALTTVSGDIRATVRDIREILPQVERIAGTGERITTGSIVLAAHIGEILRSAMPEEGLTQDQALEFAQVLAALEKLENTTNQLNSLVGSTGDLVASPAWQLRLSDVENAATRGIDQAYVRIVTFIIIFWVAALITLLIYRLIAQRLIPNPKMEAGRNKD